MSYFSNLRQNDLLRPFGFQRRRMVGGSVVPAFAILGVGLAIGAGIGLLFAPKAGRELRNDLGRRAGQLTDSVRNAVPKRNDNEWSTPNASST